MIVHIVIALVSLSFGAILGVVVMACLYVGRDKDE